MKLRNIMAGFAASAVAFSALAVAASAADATGTPGTAGIAFADGNWTCQYWLDGNEYATKENTVLITGDGQYTVSVEAYTTFTDEETGDDVTQPGASNIAFAAVQVVEGETLFPGMVITIDSVKFDGKEVTLNGTPYTSSDEQITTRVNLYNEWVPAPPDDARTVDGLAADATPTAMSNSVGDWNTMEVTFTVSGTAGAADAAAPVEETAAPAAEEAAPAAEEAAPAPATGDVAAATVSTKGSPETGIEDVAVVAGLAVVAAGAIAVAKKRK
ncbi:MAG: hypothetical protein II820_09590 [Ruminiclostridium sp.]|nr:hypothetical protein [Ruminiclostridium sp.]